MEKIRAAAVIRAVVFGAHRPIRVTVSSTREGFAARTASPQFKRQAGFGKEDQDLVPALATAKHASCCRCAQRRSGIPDRDRPLPGSQPLVHSLRDRTTQSCLADGEAGRIPWLAFYGDRTCGTSRSDGSSPKSDGTRAGMPAPRELKVKARGQECPRHTCFLLFDSLQAE